MLLARNYVHFLEAWDSVVVVAKGKGKDFLRIGLCEAEFCLDLFTRVVGRDLVESLPASEEVEVCVSFYDRKTNGAFRVRADMLGGSNGDVWLSSGLIPKVFFFGKFGDGLVGEEYTEEKPQILWVKLEVH